MSGNTFVTVATVPATILADGHHVAFSLDLLGDDDGELAYKVTVQTQVSPTPGFTGIQDYMPDLGDPAGRVDASEDGVPTSTIKYTVLSLPASGTLLDIEDNALSVGDRLLTPIVKYAADSGTGLFTATFVGENTALIDANLAVDFNIVVVGTCDDNEAFCDDGRS